MLGECVAGAIAASYGGNMTAVLDTWRVTNADEWHLLCPLPFPDTLAELDTNCWAVDGVPDLGGNAYFYAGESFLTGVRIKPPPQDPHEYRRDRKARKDGKQVKIDLTEDEKRAKSKRREDRSKSCVRYSDFRTAVNEPPVTRGQHRSSSRGRKLDRSKRR